MKKINRAFFILLIAALLLCFIGCTAEQGTQGEASQEPQGEGSGVEGGDFSEHSSLTDAFSTPGNTTVTLASDERPLT